MKVVTRRNKIQIKVFSFSSLFRFEFFAILFQQGQAVLGRLWTLISPFFQHILRGLARIGVFKSGDTYSHAHSTNHVTSIFMMYFRISSCERRGEMN